MIQTLPLLTSLLVTPEMVRQLLLESCAPDWDLMVRMASDLEKQLDEEPDPHRAHPD